MHRSKDALSNTLKGKKSKCGVNRDCIRDPGCQIFIRFPNGIVGTWYLSHYPMVPNGAFPLLAADIF